MIERDSYETRIRRALELEGGLYSFEDVLDNISSGTMQGFSDDNDSFIVTRISTFPRKTVLEIILIVGEADEILALEPRLIEFAKANGCEAMLGYGRLGWENLMPEGWRKVFALYLKELPL